MGWMKLILDLLTGAASIAQIFQVLRPGESRSESPFEVLPIQELSSAVASPLRTPPLRIPRSVPICDDLNFQIISGGSGVGKTRAALDTVSALADATQAETIYMARKYVEAMVPLPQAASVRKVIVFIDDYDYGSIPASSLSFEERKAAYSQALTNLVRLRDILRSRVDLYGIIVTINSHRMPVSEQDVAGLLNDFVLLELPQVSPEEHKNFLGALENSLGVAIDDDARPVLENACDGRFNTIATFLSSFPKGARVSKEKAEQYLTVLQRVWDLFSSKLSAQQKWVYDQVKSLKDFGLAPRLEYLSYMAHGNPDVGGTAQIDDALHSLWPIRGGQAIVYDGQFGPPNRTPDLGRRVADTCMAAGRRIRLRNRYAYQQELKSLAEYLSRLPEDSTYLRVLRKCNRWFPRDRYFAYLLAQKYANKGRSLRAMVPLYRVFRDFDPHVLFSGKWVEIQAHLLLGHLYQSIGLDKRRDWDSHRRMEHEFEVAAMLADLELPDTGAEGYELVASSNPDPDWEQMLGNNLKELGFEMPSNLSLDSKRLRAMVHHSYSNYLLKQLHREHEALEHEAVVTELLPEFGEAYLQCAMASMQIGDSRRALSFLDHASSAMPQYMHEVTFAFTVAHGRWFAHADLGEDELARKYFRKCKELSLKDPLSNDEHLRAKIELEERDVGFWQRTSRLAQIRDKVFGSQMIYRLPSQGIEVVLPSDWKIDHETYKGEREEYSLIAIFTSPVTWDATTKSPSDAMVNLYYTTETQHLERDVESFGLWWLKLQPVSSRNKFTWQQTHERSDLGAATFCQWHFDIRGSWPKTGTFLAFALPNARVFLYLMCEVCGRSTFWTTLESVGQAFKQQVIFKG